MFCRPLPPAKVFLSWSLVRVLPQIAAAVKDRFQTLHKQLGAAGYAKQEPLVDQRGRLKDMRAQAASVLARVRAVQSEASDAACVTAYTELLLGLRALAVPAMRVAAAGGVAVVDALEAPVSTAGLSVSLDATGVLAAIGSVGMIEVRIAAGVLLRLVLSMLVSWHETHTV